MKTNKTPLTEDELSNVATAAYSINKKMMTLPIKEHAIILSSLLILYNVRCGMRGEDNSLTMDTIFATAKKHSV